MPFRSKAQRAWMYANKPEMAKEWSDHTPKGKKLPEKVQKTAMQVLGMKVAVALQQQQLIPGAPPVQKIVPAGAPQPTQAAPQPGAQPPAPPPLPGDPKRPPSNNAEAVAQREAQKRQQAKAQPPVPAQTKIACAKLRQDMRKVAAAVSPGAAMVGAKRVKVPGAGIWAGFELPLGDGRDPEDFDPRPQDDDAPRRFMGLEIPAAEKLQLRGVLDRKRQLADVADDDSTLDERNARRMAGLRRRRPDLVAKGVI